MPTRAQSPTRSSTPRLSEAARHLIVPRGIVTTRWPSIKAVCSAFGVKFDPWQDGLGSAILGQREDGIYAADTIVISIPRQVGKTFLLGSIALALCIADPGTLVLWTAHRSATAQDTFRDLKALAERPELKAHVKATYDSGDRREVVFVNGSRIAFGARERGFGRGFKKVGVLIFDEAQILTDKGLDDMVPTTNRHPNPLVLMAGTPPKPSDPGEAFTRFRTEAIDGETTDVLFVEMSADPDADPTDREQWAKANPSYPEHTKPRAMLRMLKLLGVASFLREGLGIWDGTARLGVFRAGSWAACLTNEPPPSPAALGIAADLDQNWFSLAAASSGPRPHLGSTLRSQDRDEFAGEVARIQAEHKIPVAIDATEIRAKDGRVTYRGGPASALVPNLLSAGVVLTFMTTDDFIQACADMRVAVEKKRVTHGDYTELNEAVDSAGWRKIGDRRAFARKSGDISSLEAAALALWGAVNGNVESVYEDRGALVL